MIRALVIAVSITLVLPFDSGRVEGPSLVTVQNLPVEVRRLTDETWASFLHVFSGKRGCIGIVALELVADVEGGAAEYLPPERLVRIEIPTTPLRFPESLAHELGHHLEEVCSVEREIGAAFRAASRFDPDADWTRASRWRDRPSEHFAEAVVLLVLGERLTHADVIELDPSAVELVEAWASTRPR